MSTPSISIYINMVWLFFWLFCHTSSEVCGNFHFLHDDGEEDDFDAAMEVHVVRECVTGLYSTLIIIIYHGVNKAREIEGSVAMVFSADNLKFELVDELLLLDTSNVSC